MKRFIDLFTRRKMGFRDAVPMLRQSVIDNVPCFVNKHMVDSNGLRFRGWALPGNAGPGRARFLINGRKPDQVRYPLPSKHLAEKFGQNLHAANAGFEVSVSGEPDEIFGDAGFAELEFQGDGVASPRSKINRWWVFDPRREQPLPEGERAYRVVGNESIDNYMLGGATVFKRLQHILAIHASPTLFEQGPVFDWGCGSGRVTRYFMHGPKSREIWGGDVDKNNLAWCRESFDDANFVELPLAPPSSLPDDYFRFVFGISVFTHLKEAVQLDWLRELSRITAPGGCLIMSVRGNTSLGFGVNPKLNEWVYRRDRDGYVNVGVDSRVNEQLEDQSYYVNCLQSKDYIRREWGKIFQVVDIVDAGGIHQDFVVLKKK